MNNNLLLPTSLWGGLILICFFLISFLIVFSISNLYNKNSLFKQRQIHTENKTSHQSEPKEIYYIVNKKARPKRKKNLTEKPKRIFFDETRKN